MRGRTYYYQYYTNVIYSTPERCLSWHGKIARNPRTFAPATDGCVHRILAFPHKELAYHREQERLMRAIAQAELHRRELFAAATRMLDDDPDQAVELFSQAARIEVYIPELERLVAEKEQALAARPDVRERLGKIFHQAYSDKFGRRRYERLPELMRIAREQAGLARIKELFAL